MWKTDVEMVYEHSRRIPGKTAVRACDGEATYARLWELARGYGQALEKAGVGRGSRVLLQGGQTLAYAAAYLGIHLAGGVVTAVERDMPAGRVRSIVKSMGIRAVVGGWDEAVFGAEAVRLPFPDVQAGAETQAADGFDLVFPDLEDSADILFTTGTTGASKGVEHSHCSLTAAAENVIYGCGYQEDTVMIVPGPLNHAGGERKLYASLLNGGTLVILDGVMDVNAFFQALGYPAGKLACCLSPSALRVIFSLTGDRIGAYRERIDFIELVSSPLPEADKERLCRLLPDSRLYNHYGLSEAGSVCLYDYNRYKGLPDCIGRATKNTRIFIADENGKEIDSSKERWGYLACSGESLMRGYVDEPELTREVMRDGVLYTSDLGYIDADGFVYVKGRKGDVINVGGLKVSPQEVEAAALAYEGVEDCICVPAPHPITGKALKLLVKMEGELDQAKLSRYLRERLESYKVPASYEKVERIARTYNGKLDRKFYAE